MTDEIAAEATEPVVESKMTKITLNDFQKELAAKVSGYNANLLLNLAVAQSGIDSAESDTPLNEADVKSLCIELINKGGPSFQVGRSIYGQIQ